MLDLRSAECFQVIEKTPSTSAGSAMASVMIGQINMYGRLTIDSMTDLWRNSHPLNPMLTWTMQKKLHAGFT